LSNLIQFNFEEDNIALQAVQGEGVLGAGRVVVQGGTPRTDWRLTDDACGAGIEASNTSKGLSISLINQFMSALKAPIVMIYFYILI
jgi:hypothetical protein